MSPFFIKTYLKDTKCRGCEKSKLIIGKKAYSVCSEHLKAARDKWRNWSVIRREQGLCCYCHRKSYKGWLRCKFHTLENREKCLRWIEEHPEHYHEAWMKKKKLMEAGFCPTCKEHRPLPTGFKRCDPCRARRKNYK